MNSQKNLLREASFSAQEVARVTDGALAGLEGAFIRVLDDERLLIGLFPANDRDGQFPAAYIAIDAACVEIL